MLIVGVLLVTVGVGEAAATALSPNTRAGPLTGGLLRQAWRVLRAAGRRASVVLSASGPVLLAVTGGLWILVVWLGWLLIFSADTSAVVSSTSGAPADFFDRVYYTTYTLFTMGNGDFRPAGAPWQAATSVALANGLALVTLAITYLVPVVTAISARRHQASMIAALGPDPVAIVRAGWDGEGFEFLESRIDQLMPSVMMTAQRHLPYPVMHYIRGREVRSAFPPQVAALDEAVTILERGVAPEARPQPARLRSFRSALDQLLGILEVQTSGEEQPVPPPPSLAPLTEVGIPTVDQDDFEVSLQGAAPHRARLREFVAHGGWEWERDVLARD